MVLYRNMLYLDGDFKLVKGRTCYSNATQCICLASAYLKKLNISVVIVQDCNCFEHGSSFLKDKQPQTGFKLPKNCFKEVTQISSTDLNDNVKNSCLPAIYDDTERLLISGLCHILRFLVKHASQQFDSKFKHLLGHKKFCLKATSEVSSRTNLCEVIGPSVIDNWNSNFANSIVPDALLQIEKLLNEPVSIHNRDKRQRVLLRKLTTATLTIQPCEDSEPNMNLATLYRTNLNAKLAVRTNDLPALEHVFAEGVELTLTDIALLPFAHAFFTAFSREQNSSIVAMLPSTSQWYNRLWNDSEISNAASLAGVTNTMPNVCSKSLDVNFSRVSEVLRLGDSGSNNPKKIKKKELEKTIRRDLPAVLKKTTSLSQIHFHQFEKESIFLNWKSYPVEIHPAEGELSSKRAVRKCHQIENLFQGVKSLCRDGDTVVDFCAGGGHVGIVIAHLLPRCNVIIIENKEESLERAKKRIAALNLKNIKVYQCNLQNYRGSFDIGVALHACGVATDLVLRKCLAVGASFVISPCCYGKIQNIDTVTYPQSKVYKEADIDYDSLVLLGHAGDQTSWDFDGEKPKQGKRCMELVDIDRAAYAKEFEYETELHTMQPRDCSPKNNLIIGRSPSISITSNAIS